MQEHWPDLSTAAQIAAFSNHPIAEAAPAETTYDLIARAAHKWPERTAIREALMLQAPVSWTYPEFFARVTQAANAFAKLGIRRNDVVAYLLPNLAETHAVIWGAQAAGVVAAINPFLEPEQIAAILKESGARTLVVPSPELDSEIWARARVATEIAPVDHLITIGRQSRDSAGSLAWDVMLATAPSGRLEPTPPRGDDLAAYFHTGGTTGMPKLARHTHRKQAYNGWLSALFQRLVSTDVSLIGLPLFHVNAVIVSGLAPFSAGASIVIAGPRGFRNRQVIDGFDDLVSRFGVTLFNAVPTVYAALLEKRREPHNLQQLRFGGSGGAPMPEALLRRAERELGIAIVEGYGLTETTCALTANPVEGIRKIGSVGLTAPYHEIRIASLDDPHRMCAAGEIGSVLVRGPCTIDGYKSSSASRSLYRDNGWLDTGDLGRKDDDGYLWLTGRAKDIIIRGGHNIEPATIEEALLQHPAVDLAAAVGRIDAYSGEVPVAFVTLRNGAQVDPAELLIWARDKVPERAAAPLDIVVLDHMPVTAVGKIHKPPLRLMAARSAINDALAKAGIKLQALELVPIDGVLHATLTMDCEDDAVAAAEALADFNISVSCVQR